MTRVRSCWFLTLVGVLACAEGESQSADRMASTVSALRVHVVNYPLAYFADRIGGDEVRVVFPAPPEMDPAFWSPAAETIASYQNADLILLNGAGYAGWVRWATLPPKNLVDTSSAFSDRLISTGEGPIHRHGTTGEHSHAGTAFTTWIDPQLAILQARSIADAFANARPATASSVRTRLSELESDLADLDRRFAAASKELGNQPILFSHPVYQYLERRYRLNGRSLHWEPGTDQDDASWRALERILAAHPARLMLWEAAPTEATRARLATLGISVAVFDPCGRKPVEGDYLTVMNRNADALARAASSP